MLIVQDNPKSPISEAYRTLRTNIQFSNFDNKLSTILITSPGPSEGKSTTSANLASSGQALTMGSVPHVKNGNKLVKKQNGMF